MEAEGSVEPRWKLELEEHEADRDSQLELNIGDNN